MENINEVFNRKGKLNGYDLEDFEELTDKVNACAVLLGGLFRGVDDGYTPNPEKAIQHIEYQLLGLHKDMVDFFNARISDDCTPLRRIGG